MNALSPRVGRWPLALTLALLGACADETTSPTFSAPLRPNAAAGDVYLVTTPYDNGAIGSLRWALKHTTGGETIRFDASLAGQTVWVDSLIWVSKTVTIEGPQGAGITINGSNSADRLFRAEFTGTLTFRNVTVTGYDLYNLVGPVVIGTADLVLENSLLTGNAGGGGNIVYAGNVTLINSTVSNNTASNVAAGQQYGAVQGDTVMLINSTVANNGDAGVVSGSGRITLRNSIVSGHPRDNCHRYYYTGTVVREGTNISDDDKCGGPGEIIIADPLLAPLADNGGPTKTRALLTGSPAINTGTACSVSLDQRYFPRDAQCDVGAFEFADFTTVTITVDPASYVKQATGAAVLSGTISCSRTESFMLGVILTQEQKVGKTPTKVHAHADVPVNCSPVARTFSASMTLDQGGFEPGSGVAEVRTLDAEPWVTPASVTETVRLVRGR